MASKVCDIFRYMYARIHTHSHDNSKKFRDMLSRTYLYIFTLKATNTHKYIYELCVCLQREIERGGTVNVAIKD